jgi:hypothetical protein
MHSVYYYVKSFADIFGYRSGRMDQGGPPFLQNEKSVRLNFFWHGKVA